MNLKDIQNNTCHFFKKIIKFNRYKVLCKLLYKFLNTYSEFLC